MGTTSRCKQRQKKNLNATAKYTSNYVITWKTVSNPASFPSRARVSMGCLPGGKSVICQKWVSIVNISNTGEKYKIVVQGTKF